MAGLIDTRHREVRIQRKKEEAKKRELQDLLGQGVTKAPGRTRNILEVFSSQPCKQHFYANIIS